MIFYYYSLKYSHNFMFRNVYHGCIICYYQYYMILHVWDNLLAAIKKKLLIVLVIWFRLIN